jgi:hypothetical protein
MRTIRASELGTFLFCQRAWWYRLQGYEPDNQEELTFGADLHYRKSLHATLSRYLRTMAIGFLLLALILGLVYVTGQ